MSKCMLGKCELVQYVVSLVGIFWFSLFFVSVCVCVCFWPKVQQMK